MKLQEKFEVTEDEAAVRLDVFLANKFIGEYSRSQISRWTKGGHVRVNGEIAKANRILKAGNSVEIDTEVHKESGASAENIPLQIVYEDKDLIVVNKPAGLVVHPGAGNTKRTLVNALLFHSKSLSKGSHAFRPGIVHRLDKGTSGLLVVAKNDKTHEGLAAQFKDHSTERRYWVVVHGVVEHDELCCEESLGRSPLNRRKVIIEPVAGKPSTSYFTVLERFRNATLLEARLETGRTHQIRVHLKYLGYPVLGDLDYGVLSRQIGRQALHAKTLGFIHPRTKKQLSFNSELPDDFLSLLEYLRENIRSC